MSKAKVLVVGDVRGRLPALEARLKAVNDSHGPFAAAFCVGDFAGGDWSCIAPYRTGERRMPVPVFIAVADTATTATAGASSSSSSSSAAAAADATATATEVTLNDEGCELAPQITYLGIGGVKTIAGLRVAFASGLHHMRVTEGEDSTADEAVSEAETPVETETETEAAAADTDADTAAAADTDADTAAAAAAAAAANPPACDAAGIEDAAANAAAATDTATAAAAAAAASATASADSDVAVEALAEPKAEPPPFVATLTANTVAGVIRAVTASRLQVDLLLTAEWPTGFHHRMTSSALPALPVRSAAAQAVAAAAAAAGGDADAAALIAQCSSEGSALVAALARNVKPRYHFASGRELHFARPPYVNSAFPASLDAARVKESVEATAALPGSDPVAATSTRFTALGPVPAEPGSADPKWMTALALVPAASLQPAELFAVPRGASLSPLLATPLSVYAPAVGESATATVPGMDGSAPSRGVTGSVGPSHSARHFAGSATGAAHETAASAGAAGFVASLLGSTAGSDGQVMAPGPAVPASALAASSSSSSAASAAAPITAASALQSTRAAADREAMARIAAEVEAAGPDMAGAGAAVHGSRAGTGGAFFARSTGAKPPPRGRKRQRDGGESESADGQSRGQGDTSGFAAGIPMVPDEKFGGSAGAGAGAGAGASITLQRQDCWFCPSSTEFSAHMVVSIGDEAYLTLPRGPVGPDHFLLVPIPHTVSMAAASQAVRAEMGRYMAALRAWLGTRGLSLVSFERAVRTRGSAHAHVQAFGVPAEAAARAVETFHEVGRDSGIAFAEVPAADEEGAPTLAQLAGSDQYFCAELPVPSKGKDATVRLFHKVPRHGAHPLQFGRKAVCTLLGCLDRLRWNNCSQSEGEETAAAETARQAFGPHDFSLGAHDDAE